MGTDLVSLEERFWEAAGDAGFYRRRFAEDGRCVFGFGVLDKEATVASMESAEPWSSFELHEVSVVEPAPGTAALLYRATATRGGEPYEARVSSVYVRRDGDWRLFLHHQVPVP